MTVLLPNVAETTALAGLATQGSVVVIEMADSGASALFLIHGHTDNPREGLAENDYIMSWLQAGKWYLKEASSMLFSPRVMAVLIKKLVSLASFILNKMLLHFMPFSCLYLYLENRGLDEASACPPAVIGRKAGATLPFLLTFVLLLQV